VHCSEYLAHVIRVHYIKTVTGLHNIKAIVDKIHCSFIDKLIADVSYSNLLLVYTFLILCIICSVFVCMYVCVSVFLATFIAK